MIANDLPGAVVIGAYANGLAVVRALAARGLPVDVVVTKPFDIAQYSRYVSEAVALPEMHEQPDSLLELLEARAETWRGRVLFPTNDHALEVLARHHEVLSATFRPVAPPWPVARLLLRKDETYRIAAELGIDTPHVYGPATRETASRGDLRYPLVVRPVEGHVFAERFDQKLFLARTVQELGAFVERVGRAGIDAQIVDFVPGGDDRIYAYCLYVDEHGEPTAGLTVRKLRQSPPFFGVARVAEVAPEHAELREAAVGLLRRAGFRGMANVEFKQDPRDGRYRLMEANGRPFLYSGLVRRAGIDLPCLAWADHVGVSLPPMRRNDWNGVWIHLHADVLYSLFFRRLEGLTLPEYLGPYLRPRTFATWSARDPKPFFAQWSRSARDGLRMLAHRDARNALRARAQAPSRHAGDSPPAAHGRR